MKKGWLCDWRLDRTGNSMKVTTEECLECAATWDNPCQWPAPLMRWVLTDREKRPEDSISLTTLINNCPREKFFKLTKDYWDSIRGWSAAIDGIMWHTAAEQAKSDSMIVEQVFGYPLTDDFTLTFRPDLILPNLGIVVDYKRTRNAPRKGQPWSNHALQVSGELLALNSTRLCVPVGKRFGAETKPHKPFNLEAAEVDYYSVADGLRIRCRLYENPGKGQYPILDDALSTLQDRLPLFQSAVKGKPPSYRDCVGTAQSPGPWRWKCKGYCSFPDECRKMVRQEEAKQGKGFTKGLKEGRQSIIQQLSTEAGATEFVTMELDEQSKGFLTEALKGEK